LSEQITLAARTRAAAGKGETNRLRREGRVPAIVYGHKVDPTPVSVDGRELFHALNGPAGKNAVIALDIEGTTTTVVARDLQRHPVRREIIHLDLYAVDQAQQIDVSIPVHLVGVEDLARDGGYMNQVRMVAPIRVRPSDVPDFIELSVAGMGIGDVKRLGDILELLPKGAELGDDPDRVIVTINAPAGGGTGDASAGEATAEAAPTGDAASA
jgi:large subunit ribosomal protein L25